MAHHCSSFRLNFRRPGLTLADVATFRRELGAHVNALRPLFRSADMDEGDLLFGEPEDENCPDSRQGKRYPSTIYQLNDEGVHLTGFGEAAAAVRLLAHALRMQGGQGPMGARLDEQRTDRELRDMLLDHSVREEQYKLTNWAPLSGPEHKRFKDPRLDLMGRIQVLQRCLDRQLATMIAALFGADVLRTLPQARLQFLLKQHHAPRPVRKMTGHGQGSGTSGSTPAKHDRALAFDVIFSLPVLLPEHCGLGRHVAHGMGGLYRQKVRPRT
jgi:hypothetical protein